MQSTTYGPFTIAECCEHVIKVAPKRHQGVRMRMVYGRSGFVLFTSLEAARKIIAGKASRRRQNPATHQSAEKRAVQVGCATSVNYDVQQYMMSADSVVKQKHVSHGLD